MKKRTSLLDPPWDSVLLADSEWDSTPDPKIVDLFRPQDVELLLDQAADLLERILRDQNEFDALGEKLFEANYIGEEKVAYEALLTVSGYTDKPLKEASSLAASEDFNALKALTSSIDKELHGANYLVNVVSSNGSPNSAENNIKKRRDLAGTALVGAGNENKDPRYAAAVAARDWDLKVEAVYQGLGQAVAEGKQAQHSHAAAAADIRSELESAVAALRNKYRDKRVANSDTSGHALNYKERRKWIQDRMDKDFEQAKARVAQAKIGLVQVYGVTYGSQGDMPDLDLSAPKGAGTFSSFLVWVRAAISFLVAKTRRDQAIVLPVSLKKASGSKWQSGFQNGKWDLIITSASGGLPSAYSLDRIRGVALSIVPGTSQGNTFVPGDVWRGTIENTVTKANAQAEDRITCFVPRIRQRDALREADVVGDTVLYNRPAISTKSQKVSWTVSIELTSLLGKPLTLAVVQDIWVEFHLAMQV